MIKLHKDRTLGIYLFLLFISCLFFFLSPLELSPEWIKFSIILDLIIVVFHFIDRTFIIHDRDVLSFDKLFIGSYLLVHKGYLLPYSISLVDYDPRMFWNPMLASRTAMAITVGLAAFVFGYNMITRPSLRELKNTLSFKRNNYLSLWFLLGRVSIIVGVFLMILFVRSVGIDTIVYRQYGFSIFYSGMYSTTLFSAGKLLISSGIAIFFSELMSSKKNSIQNLLFLIIIGGYMFFLSIFKVRSWIILDIFLPLLFTFHYLKKPVTRRTAFTLLLLLLFVSVLIERGRSSGDLRIGSFVQTLEASFQADDFSFWELTSRIGITVKNVNGQMSIVPIFYNYSYGSAFIVNIVRSFPILGSTILHQNFESPSRLLAKVIDPWHYDHFEGIGYSIIAEAYQNFGFMGIVIFMISYGWLGNKLNAKARNSNKFGFFVLYLVVLTNMVFAIRQDITSVLRPTFGIIIIWGFIDCIYNLRIIKFKRQKSTLVSVHNK